MKKEVLNLTIVTPLLLHGSDPTAEAELRPPSFRGEIRYWFRACAGAVISRTDMKGLHTLEGAIWGNTENGGAVSTRIIANPNGLMKGNQVLLPHKSGASRPAIRSGNFEIILSARRPVSNELWQAARDSLELAIVLGAFGQRARRGFGALSRSIPSYKSQEQAILKITNLLTGSLKNMRAFAGIVNVDTGPMPAAIPTFPCFSNKARIWLGTHPYSSGIEAIKDFMARIQKSNYLGGISPRHSSPLWMKPVQINQQFYLLMTFLPSTTCCPDDRALKEVETILSGYPKEEIKGWAV
ncbi:MAG TPA: type III-B CRISPR module RAMP protein Cmr1 [Anaerolineaceae bacterium]|nr:type III-B CRISPR module RAMP protein Cmr1 [Anaerolineaceae bacterium]HPN53857.1 type III-B CRISPR module RAMP protein Cmr1 [Anaerolineaceae bacterium]